MDKGDTLLKIVNDLKEFPQTEKRCVMQLIEHHEWNWAFETMCQVIKKEKLHIPWETYERIITIGTHMELDPYVWDDVLLLVAKYLN